MTNVPVYSPEAIAELAVTDMMRLIRRSKIFDLKQSKGDLRWAPNVADEMDKMTVGIFGTGHIGRMVLKIVRDGFGANVIGYDPYPNPQLKKEGIYVKTQIPMARPLLLNYNKSVIMEDLEGNLTMKKLLRYGVDAPIITWGALILGLILILFNYDFSWILGVVLLLLALI
ncbi:MAG: Hypothetical protein AJITA_00026 [Acetilactobacillus jinshanensis]